MESRLKRSSPSPAAFLTAVITVAGFFGCVLLTLFLVFGVIRGPRRIAIRGLAVTGIEPVDSDNDLAPHGHAESDRRDSPSGMAKHVTDPTPTSENEPLESQRADKVYNHGYDLAQSGKPEEAIPYFQRAIALDPKMYIAHLELGNAHADLGRFDEAKACYEVASSIHPDWALAYHNLGILYIERGDDVAGLKHLNKAIEVYPDYNRPYLTRIKLFQKLGRHDEAIADLNFLIETNLESSGLFLSRGKSLLALKKYERALGDANEALRLDSTDASVHRLRAEIFTALGRDEEAGRDNATADLLEQQKKGGDLRSKS